MLNERGAELDAVENRGVQNVGASIDAVTNKLNGFLNKLVNTGGRIGIVDNDTAFGGPPL